MHNARFGVESPSGVLLTVNLGAVRATVEEDSRRAAVIHLVVVDLHIVATFGRDDSCKYQARNGDIVFGRQVSKHASGGGMREKRELSTKEGV